MRNLLTRLFLTASATFLLVSPLFATGDVANIWAAERSGMTVVALSALP